MSALGFDFLRPVALAWLAAAIAVALLGAWALSRRRAERARLVGERQLARFLPEFSPTRAKLRVVLAATALAMLALALSGPVRGYTVRAIERRGLDLVVCLDTSRSMLVRDVRPDRLSRAKREISDLLNALRGDRAALIAFSGEPRQIAPLTHDVVTLAKLLETATPEDNTQGGTDLGGAIERALSLFDGASGAHEAIVLVTDGEDLEGKGLDVARRAAERGIRVFVLGVGSEEGGKIPLARGDGGEGLVRDKQGNEVVSALHAESLTRLAEATGGAYLGITQSARPLQELYEKRINQLEGRAYQGGEERVPHDRFQWFLAVALACMLAEAGLRERVARERRSGATWAARRARASVAGLLLVPLAPRQAPPQSVEPPHVDTASAGEPATIAAPRELPRVESFAEGLRDLRTLAGEKKFDDALAIADALLAPNAYQRWRGEREAASPWTRRAFGAVEPLAELVGLGGATDALRAEAHYAAGIVLVEAGKVDPARARFHAARALAGQGSLRLDAGYNLGALALALAEIAREDMKGGAQQPGAPGAPSGDPLARLEEAYRRAKELLIDRLKADWTDEDTRANLELIQRRLREIAQQREQQQDEQKSDQQEQKPSDDKQQDSKDQSKSDDEQQQDPSEQEQQDGEQKPSDEQDDPEQPSDAQQPDDQKPAEEQPSESNQDAQPDADPQKADAEQAQPMQERAMSREELMQLLDQLQKIEQEGKAVRARLQQKRRQPVDRDW